MEPITYIDRQSGEECIEEVYGAQALNWLYGTKPGQKPSSSAKKCRTFSLNFWTDLLSKNLWISSIYGWWQKRSWTKKKIASFIIRFGIDTSEFLDPVSSYRSFNDFFIRKLKKTSRPVAAGDSVAVIPADGRYRFIPNIAAAEGFIVKGQKFSLQELLGSEELAAEFAEGSMVMARLCPVDYHRFHFPCEGIPDSAKMINGFLYSVNPIALKRNIDIYSQNKRMITVIQTEIFGKILYLEIGATNVGSIHETYMPGKLCEKGEEKGFFSFGGSALILLFRSGTIHFDNDLLLPSASNQEILCRMGQSMGRRS